MSTTDIIAHGGTLQPDEKTTHMVTYWVIPEGSRYDLAYIRNAFFSDKAQAEKFQLLYEMPPEMADLRAYDDQAKAAYLAGLAAANTPSGRY
jgi:hypothetical protein